VDYFSLIKIVQTFIFFKKKVDKKITSTCSSITSSQQQQKKKKERPLELLRTDWVGAYSKFGSVSVGRGHMHE